MPAKPGDTLIVIGHAPDVDDRDAEIIDVRGEHGGPPYLVRWTDDGHVSLFFPDYDAYLRPRGCTVPATRHHDD